MPVLKMLTTGERQVPVDESGYLKNFHDWNEKVAAALAAQEGVQKPTPEMYEAMTFIRAFYKKHHFFPIVNAVCKNIHKPKGCVQEEFLNPLVAWKLAGLPKPEEPIIGLLEAGQSPG